MRALAFIPAIWMGYTLAEAPSIGGDANITVTTEAITTIANGNNATAYTAIASIVEGETNGDLNITVVTGEVTNAAEGDGACSQVIIGSIVGNVGCSQRY